MTIFQKNLTISLCDISNYIPFYFCDNNIILDKQETKKKLYDFPKELRKKFLNYFKFLQSLDQIYIDQYNKCDEKEKDYYFKKINLISCGIDQKGRIKLQCRDSEYVKNLIINEFKDLCGVPPPHDETELKK